MLPLNWTLIKKFIVTREDTDNFLSIVVGGGGSGGGGGVSLRYLLYNRQSDKRRNHFKDDMGETSERRSGAHMGFPKGIDTILN